MNNYLNGPLICARYTFAPNWYHYCGPDTKGELGQKISASQVDGGLIEALSRFETLYPYLQAIAWANNLRDPFDVRVVEAYWIGNSLLRKVTESQTYNVLLEKQQLKKRLPSKEIKWLVPKVNQPAFLHHSFHVFNIFTRTGHHTVPHTIESMDQCRISWGQIDQSYRNGDVKVRLDSQQLVYVGGKLRLMPIKKTAVIMNKGEDAHLKAGDWLSCHWGIVCDRLTPAKVKQLHAYTLHHLQLANTTL